MRARFPADKWYTVPRYSDQMEKLYVRPELREMGTVAAKATNLLTRLPIVVGGEMCVWQMEG